MSSIFRTPSGPFEPPTPLYHLVSQPLHFLVYYAHHLVNRFRGAPTHPRMPIRVVCLSDTHTLTLPVGDVPTGDVLIHAGDMGIVGTAAEIQAQIDWLASLPHPHKIVICGNHDGFMDPRSRKVIGEDDDDDHNGGAKTLNWHSIIYLQHSSTTIRVPISRQQQGSARPGSSQSTSTGLSSSGASLSSSSGSRGGASSATPLLPTRTLKIYGAPQIPACGGADNAFQYERGRDAWSDTVPADTDVLVTHTPPRWHRDLPWGQGCEHLLAECWRVQPRLHVCGHVHGGRGLEHVYWDEAERAYEAICEGGGGVRSIFNPRAWLDAVRVLAHGLLGLLWNRAYGGRSDGTTIINAGLVEWTGKKIVHKPIVVDI